MRNDIVSFGVEAEFVNLTPHGDIQALSPYIILPEDEVGTDGHSETVEIRTSPSHSVVTQLERLREAVTKYRLVLESSSPKYSAGTCMRGGACYSTPLSVHIHFGNFPSPEWVPWMVTCLHFTLNAGFAKKLEDPREAASRSSMGYGGTDLNNAIRVKGFEWWEWRELSSLFIPACMKVFLGVSDAIVQLVLSQRKEVRKGIAIDLKKGMTTPQFLLALSDKGIETELGLMSLSKLTEELLRQGPLDWNKDLLPLWNTGGKDKK